MRERFGSLPAAALLAAVLATAVAVVTGCSGGNSSDSKTPSVAQIRLDAFVTVAQRIYAHEHARVGGAKVIKQLSAHAALIRALESGNRSRVRAVARKPVLGHEVRIRIVRGSQVLMDAGLPHVVQAAEGELRAPDGTDLGRVQVSVQDLIGFVKLVDRQTGTRTVVRGQNGSVETQFHAAAR